MITNDPLYTKDVLVASGGTTSTKVDLQGHVIVALITPASLTSTTCEIQSSPDNGATWLPVYDQAGTKLEITLGASRWIALVPGDLAGLRLVRLVTGSAEADDRTIKISARPLG